MDLEDVIATFQVYHHISNMGEFQKWLKEYHKIDDSNPFFLGYRYFLEICAIRIVDEIAESHFLELDEDETFLFAKEDRIPLDEIPNSCDKIIVIKNIWRFFKPIKNAQNWAELKAIIHAAKHIPKIFEEIFNSVNVNEKNSKKNVFNLITLHYVHIHFNDTQRLKPLGAAIGLIKSDVDSPGIEYFKGYAYGLEYLWYRLLEKEEFEKSPAKKIHEPWVGLDEEDYINIREVASNYHPDDPTFQERSIAWESLDHLYHPLFDICVSPRFKKFTGSRDPNFFFEKNFDNRLIAPLLERTGVSDPYYLSDDSSDEARFKKIDYYFKWLPVAYIDSGKVHDFFGTYAFIPFLLGLTTSKKVSVNNRIEVVRIKHPETGVSGFFYSYALLNKSSYFNDQGMGWIIFLTCGTDFSGHGGSMHEDAENYIKKFCDKGILEVGEITVDEDVLRRYLEVRTEKLVPDSNTSVNTLLEFGETETVEFKSSLLWSYEKNQLSESSVYDTARTISAFLNSDGGTLLIGIDKNREVVGVEKDYSLLKPLRNQNRDGFELRINEVVNTFIRKEYRQDIDVFFEIFYGKEICRIFVIPSPEPVFLINSKCSEFIVRSGPSSQLLKGREITNYITKHQNFQKR